MDVKFRIAKKKDVGEFTELCNECFEENTSYKYALEKFKKKNHDQIYLVGEVEGKIVAFTLINVIRTAFSEMGTYAILNHVCVKPEYRRNHIGERMLNECARICKENDCKMMKLWSKNFRVAAHAMYHKYGFTVIDAKFFEKDLGGENENK